MTKRALAISVTLLTIIGMCELSAGALTYRMHVLDSPRADVRAAGCAINSSDQVAGYWQSRYGGYQTLTTWDSEGPHEMKYNYLHSDSAVAINDNGDIVDGYRLWRDGVKLSPPPLLPSGHSVFCDINNNGVVAGYSSYNDSHSIYHATIWDNSGVHDLGVLPTRTTAKALALSDTGIVVGNSDSIYSYQESLAFKWENGSMTALNPSSGYSQSAAYNVNNRGQVVGAQYKREETRWHEDALMWQDGRLIDLSIAGVNSRATDVNDSGLVVGYSYVSSTLVSRAVVWENGVPTFLDDLMPGFSRAYSINRNGWIAGTSLGNDGLKHAVVWEPVPEPSSTLTLLLGLGGVKVFSKRRRR